MRRAEKIRRIYDSGPQRYDKCMPMTDRFVGRFRKKVGEEVRGRVLDVGVGTGLSLRDYPRDVSVVGIDLSPGMLAIAEQRARDLGIEFAGHVMDAEAMDFEAGTFDSVAFNLCLCTIPDPLAAVREAVRVARPGAPMLFIEHFRSHLWPVAAVQLALDPLLVWLQEDHQARRTDETVRQAGVVDVTVERGGLGVFSLIRGRAPGSAS